MTETLSSFEGTLDGISLRVGTHRRAIGVKDYPSRAEFIAAAANLLEPVFGKNLAAIAAVISANKNDKAEALAALEAQHAAKVAALEADIAALGTKEEAQSIRKAQIIAALEADILAKENELARVRA